MLLVTALSIETLKKRVLGLATAVHDSIDRDYTHSLQFIPSVHSLSLTLHG